MSILEAIGVTKDYGGAPVLDGVSFSVEPGEKLALVGRNGCGKTSLLRIVVGEDDDYKGGLKRGKGLRIAYVPQKPPEFGVGETAAGFVCRDALEARAALEALAEALADSGSPGYGEALARYARAREAYDANKGDEAEELAERLLEKVGLGDRADVAAASLSGGEKNVLAIARAVRSAPDLLVLDEPGNHLDLAGLSWLEEFVRSLPCAVLLVSHDRRMLDKVADAVLELDGGKLTRFSGGYSAYRLERLKRAAGQGQTWQADRKRVERLEALVRRFAEIARSRPDPAWGKRLRARRSQLERVKAEAAERPDLGNRDAQVAFLGETSKADLALRIDGYGKRYGELVVLEPSSLEIRNGERVALVGPNGSGKTSLVRDLVSLGSWDNPELRVGPSMRLGYCAQAQEVFDASLTVEEEFLKILPNRGEAFSHLGRFLFSYADLDKRIGSLSGGELNRLQLARASALKANFLVLDEPTNHLDIPTREAVEDALAEFEGTALVVSHDRYFLEKVAERVVFIDGRRLNEYEGSFSEYWRDVGRPARQEASRAGTGARGRAASGRAAMAGSEPGSVPERRGRDQRAQAGKANGAGSARPARGAGRCEASLEARIEAMEREKERLERASAAAFDARDYAKAKALASQLEANNARLDEAWRRLAEEG